MSASPCSGYSLGGVDFVRDHIEVMLLLIVAVSLLPIGFEFLRHRSRRDPNYDEPEERARSIHPTD